MVELGEYVSGAAECSREVGSAVGIAVVSDSAITGSVSMIRKMRLSDVQY